MSDTSDTGRTLSIEMSEDDAKAFLRSWYGGAWEGDYFKAERAARTIEDALSRRDRPS